MLGGGNGGVRVALDLAKKKNTHVILIDQGDYHSLPPQYYELATLFREEKHGETSREVRREFHRYFSVDSIPLKDIFHGLGVEVVRGHVEHVSPTNSCVTLAQGLRVEYDWLVVALGSRTNYFGIPHLEQNSFGLKTIAEALNIRDRVDELFYSHPKDKKITVVVGGGGFTGVELACELVGYMRKLGRIHGHLEGQWNCIIVEAGAAIFGGASLWVQKKSQLRLQKLGVTVLLNSPIVDVWPNLLYMGGPDNEKKRSLTFDLLVWTAGVKGSCMGEIIEGSTLDKKNCIGVDGTLRVSPHKNIFAIGDIASFVNPKTSKFIGMTAQNAIHEAKYVARVIQKLIADDRAAVTPYEPKFANYIIPLGGKYALLETAHFHASGVLVWALKYLVLARYLFSILPGRRALTLCLRELAIFSKND